MAGKAVNSNMMAGRNNFFKYSLGNPSRRLLVWMLAAVALFATGGMLRLAYAAEAKPQKSNPAPQRDPYSRPAPTVPIRPSIPGVNRYQTDKVFLEHADSLYRPPYDMTERQVVTGNVVFRQGGMWMYCDSAYYFSEQNSMNAFGHVKMTQGDTLFVYADKLFYDGMMRHARLVYGPTQPKVKMQNRRVTLTTDSLDYDLIQDIGWYDCGGKLEDDVNTLTSRRGRYSPSTKDAEFYDNVVLVNNKDGYRLLSDTLYYNTDTHLARIVTPTKILGENDTILTSSGTYNTVTGNADLSSRSTIIHKDSAGNVTTLVGDSIIYDKLTRISRAYSYGRYSHKPSLPMVLTDTARHSILIGGYGEYNDFTREAMATDYPLLKEFSQPDTIFLRADTIRTFIAEYFPPLPADSLALVAADSVAPSESDADSIGEPDSEVAPLMPSSESADLPLAPRDLDAVPATPLLDSINKKEYHIAKAYPRARFFKQDIQGVADSITFIELDSMLYLNRGPIVWSDERQVNGNVIEIHLNDSTADWARLPDSGMLMEHVDEDFFNQLAARKMLAFFSDNTLRRLEAEGNVQTIFLPEENDSTFNRLVNAESSYLTVDMVNGEMDRLKMWPEVTGDFTPIFLVKNSQKLLPGARWLDALRPKRRWLDYYWSWEDDLGELSPELEEYFRSLHSDPQK